MIAKATKPEPAEMTAPTLVLFGRDDRNRPHASIFDTADRELVEKAAGLMGMKVLAVATDEHRAAASGLPVGRLFASGKGFVPFCKEPAFAALCAFSEAYDVPLPDGEEATSPMPEATNIPESWSDITLGSLVLAATEPDQPWWPAIVAEARVDDMFMLRWRDWPTDAGIVRRREHLSLIAKAAVAA